MNSYLMDGHEALSVAELPVGAVDDLLKVHDEFSLMQPLCFGINLVVVPLMILIIKCNKSIRWI